MSEKVCWDNCDGTSWESPQKKWIPDESSKLIAKRRKIDKKKWKLFEKRTNQWIPQICSFVTSKSGVK